MSLTPRTCPSHLSLAPIPQVDEDAGVSYVAGSHLWRLQHRITNFSGDSSDDGRYAAAAMAPEVPDVDGQLAAGNVRLLKWAMSPGDILVHHGWSVHGAPGNGNLSRTRRGLATRWCGDDMRLLDKPGACLDLWS